MKNKLHYNGISAKYYASKNEGIYKDLIIIFLGGSEGGFPKLYDYSFFKKMGISYITLAYFNTKYTSKVFDRIDLNNIKKCINECYKHFKLYEKKLVIFGYSKGAELALLYSSLNPEVGGVFVQNPSSFIFQSPGSLITGYPSSSWIYKGKELPYMKLGQEIFKKCRKKAYFDLYNHSIETEKTEQAIIKVENINGPISIVSGKSDVVWPSFKMSTYIMKRLKNSNFKHWTNHYFYNDVGHTFFPFYGLGGTFKANMKAGNDLKKRIKIFLNEVLNKMEIIR